ncbi:sulfatase-like hydrolase/transferase [Pedobacter endophyticus]|uniref:Sulfatase-like hydrolase/transferase n=1 Tax=Pedobacter endophyticus TaxID=2789740 RepID=A0A7S9KZD0_9SPHI|nr:sulfatase-like hydrolase/transferase [Pedobacter endophyticus]QPH39639.1 sulfatase-like hydrolase/transferase [Pedobacter endophyticus]
MNKYKSNTLVVLLLTIVFSSLSASVLAQQKPNIIYILVDDLGYGDLGVFFQNQRLKQLPALKSPHLDEMAQSGAILTQHYANAPVCAPSRASLLTGVNQGNAHVRDNQFDKALENNHTMATMLKNAGYATIAIGKWGLQGTDEKQKLNWPAHPLKRGFDDYFGYMRHADGHEHYPVEGIYRGKKEIWANYKEVSEGFEKCYTTDLWTAKAKNYIIGFEKNNKDKKPFFMYLAYDAPHAVLELPTQSYPTGGGLNGGVQWIGQKGKMISTASGTVDSYVHADYANATYDDDNDRKTPNVPWPDTYKRYATAVRRLDDAVGDIRKLLLDLKISDNTLIVFTSDNGPSIESYLPKSYVDVKPTFFQSYGPFDGIKRDCWEGGVRMPAVVVWPKSISAGKVVATPSMLSDWMPTFARAAKTFAPVRSTGVSLLPSLTDIGKQENGLVYSEYFQAGKTPDFKEFEPDHANRKRNQMQFIRVGDFVGVRYDIQSADDNFEIFNVVKDPKQKDNLASQSGFDKLQAQMKAKVLQARISDPEAPRPYDNAAVPGVGLTGNIKKGLKWSFFKGDFDYVPSLSDQAAAKCGTAKSLNSIKTSKGIMVYQTFIKIDKKGLYSFKVSTGGKAFVKLHEANLLDADFNYKAGEVVQRDVILEEGYHPVTIYSVKSQPQQKITLQFKAEPGEWEDLTARNCFYK